MMVIAKGEGVGVCPGPVFYTKKHPNARQTVPPVGEMMVRAKGEGVAFCSGPVFYTK
jgi:hypothetical protein